jgi:hypothetical protein
VRTCRRLVPKVVDIRVTMTLAEFEQLQAAVARTARFQCQADQAHAETQTLLQAVTSRRADPARRVFPS